MCWLQIYWLSVPNPSQCLLHENRFGPFKYFSLPTGNSSLEGTGNTRQKEKIFASCFWCACWASSPGCMLFSSTRYLRYMLASNTQQPAAFPGTSPSSSAVKCRQPVISPRTLLLATHREEGQHFSPECLHGNFSEIP